MVGGASICFCTANGLAELMHFDVPWTAY
uniref:Uncharacterized protein n=1 Tax=Arundo donax TaxID=35708 RepID=A0A0A9ADJ4_ARUDO